MTTRRPTILATLLFVLLVGATSASAECAWVMWQRETINIPPRPISAEWAAPVAFADRAACVAWIERNAKEWEMRGGPGQSVTRSAGGMAAEFRTQGEGSAGTGTAHSFRCLPDTVDPRGPKGNK